MGQDRLLCYSSGCVLVDYSAELIHLGSIVAGQVASMFALVPAVSFWEHYFIRRCVQ